MKTLDFYYDVQPDSLDPAAFLIVDLSDFTFSVRVQTSGSKAGTSLKTARAMQST